MSTRTIILNIVVAIALSGSVSAQRNKEDEVKFTVRIENISTEQMASNGEKWPFALSPGMFVVHGNEVRLYREGTAAGKALEAQAEDGNPAELIKLLESRNRDGDRHGVFNTPTGASGPGPIGPGGVYEFTISAKPGKRLSVIFMFGQSNDWFYATPRQGIDLFRNGKAITGDITSEFSLYDAGTEQNEEPGIGPNQAPRQATPNTGTTENGKVKAAKDSPFYNKTAQLFRVMITPDGPMAGR